MKIIDVLIEMILVIFDSLVFLKVELRVYVPSSSLIMTTRTLEEGSISP